MAGLWSCFAVGVTLLLAHNVFGTDAEQNENRFRDPSMVQDKSHLKEHVQELTQEQINQMSPEELEFHFFKSHDTDKNLKLDGLEIMAAIDHQHSHRQPAEQPAPEHETPEQTRARRYREHQERLNFLTGMVDKILEQDDTDDDGMMSYIEYVISRRRHEKDVQASQQQRQKDLNTQLNQ
ncbi:MCFD2 [Branchiostoma lanceolatum]|uniref:MCFD2 protein n=2 Tax=Branchiostoma lanceolatum TaxID=7740 RepID=A0A8J9YPR3_BRALA|nr:MCFD2 [Branchiostoma lanceolatum]